MKLDLAILGAGISGLALGWTIKQKFGDQIKFAIFEKGNRVGGWIKSVNHQGFLFEQGPHSCRAASLDTLRLIESLNLQNEVLTGEPVARKRFLWLDQKLQQLPRSFFEFLSFPVTKGIRGSLLTEFWREKSNQDDETIYDFFSRRLNSKCATQLVDPFVSGIFAGDIHKLSLRSCFPLFHQWEQNLGSLTKGFISHKKETPSSDFQKHVLASGLFSFKKGMETLPLALASHLENEIHINHPIESLEFTSNSVCINSNIVANQVISTLPAYALAPLLDEISPSLASIPHAPIAIIHLGWKEPVLKEQGFGYLIPSIEKESILGIIWNSCVFPKQNVSADYVNLSVMIGGARFAHFSSLSHEDFIQIALKAVRKHLNISVSPDIVRHKVIPQAIPQYNLGHTRKIMAIQNFHPCLQVIGASFHGVSINDCLSQSFKCAGLLKK